MKYYVYDKVISKSRVYIGLTIGCHDKNEKKKYHYIKILASFNHIIHRLQVQIYNSIINL